MHPSPNVIPGQWTPLLDAERAQIFLKSIHEIAEVLRAPAAAPQSAQMQRNSETNIHYAMEQESAVFQLAEGAAASAVFFAYLNASGLIKDARNLAFERLNTAIEGLASHSMGISLFSGFTGIGWAVRHVLDLLGENSGDLNSDIDVALEKYLSKPGPWKDEYDLISGLVGLGVYCLEQTGSVPARHCLELIVERLYQMAERSESEVRWFTPPELLVEKQKEQYPDGYYNFGIAHGVPGIIAILGRIYEAGVARERAGWLLERAVPWLLRHRLPPTMNSSFSAFVFPGSESEDCRLAWCYGDAGVASALLLAARCTGNDSWSREALALGKRAAQRDTGASGARDVCFCHGTAGLAHIFNRFYHASHDQVFADAAIFWLEKTLSLREPGNGAAGYAVWTSRDGENIVFESRMGLIEGIAGVGLTYLAAITSIEPNWDRIFMTNIAPVSRPAE